VCSTTWGWGWRWYLEKEKEKAKVPVGVGTGMGVGMGVGVGTEEVRGFRTPETPGAILRAIQHHHRTRAGVYASARACADWEGPVIEYAGERHR